MPCHPLFVMTIKTFFSLLIIAVSFFSLYQIDGYSRAMRTGGKTPSEDIVIKRSEEAYEVWKKKGMRGRVIISMSQWLYFMPPEKDIVPSQADFPLKIKNPLREAESELRRENLLRLALESGIARKIVHVLPAEVFQEKVRLSRKIEGVRVSDGAIKYPHLGSPRLITSLNNLERIEEAVLLYIDAAFINTTGLEKIWEILNEKGIRTELIIIDDSG